MVGCLDARRGEGRASRRLAVFGPSAVENGAGGFFGGVGKPGINGAGQFHVQLCGAADGVAFAGAEDGLTRRILVVVETRF